LQKQQSKMTAQATINADQAEKIAAQASEIRALERQQRQFATQAEVQELKQQLQAALLKLRAEDELVARR